MIAGESSPSRVFMKRCNVSVTSIDRSSGGFTTRAACGQEISIDSGQQQRCGSTVLSSKRVQCHELYFSVKCDKGPNRKVARPTIVWNETS